MKKIFLIVFTLVIFILSMFYWMNTPNRYLSQGQSEIKSDKVALATSTLEKGVKKFPENIELKSALIEAYLKLDEIEKANELALEDELYKKLLLKNKNLVVSLAEQNKKNKNIDLARFFANEYLDSIKEDDITTDTIKNYVKISYIIKEKSLELCEKAYEKASTFKNPSLKESIIPVLLPKYIKKSQEYKKENNYDEAISILNKAEQLGKHPEINIAKAKIYNELNRFDLAQTQYEEAIQASPEKDEYKILYANALENVTENITDELKKKEYIEKAKLLLADIDAEKKASVLEKIINLNAKYKITNTHIFLKQVGDLFYPSFQFKITPISETGIKKCKIVFLNSEKNILDTYELELTNEKMENLLEITSKNPVKGNESVNVQLFIDDKLFKEF